MNISIIDIGTQSLKHYVFEVNGTDKKSIHYKRYSESNLGEHESIKLETIQRNITILSECLDVNKKLNVSKLQILGTDILRKASNAQDFLDAVKSLSGHTIQVVSHDLEAQYLYDGFVSMVPKDFTFAATNIGGGSTEVVIGDSTHLIESVKIPFGVKFLNKTFTVDGVVDWVKVDQYLEENININQTVENVFVTGVLDFVITIGKPLGFIFEESIIPNHPVKVSIETYINFLNVFRKLPAKEMGKLYPKDPVFADNFAMGQSVYVAIIRKLKAKTVIPSNNDLTDGVIQQLL